jgi:hypothetical protein
VERSSDRVHIEKLWRRSSIVFAHHQPNAAGGAELGQPSMMW